ncbi:uncharacterized protein IL334_001280 [Kwoniella shivajii]|uniref:Uncharacterized protein n=1 Tax=Kwoniella shivajii TaxID=564305 RepID=A0ABZ1CS36_9TREE|nr:hypothetical protein IL334_001280 [Kwoniella shivajii]
MALSQSWAEEVFNFLIEGERIIMMEYIEDDVEWTVINSEVKSTSASGVYPGKKEFGEKAVPILVGTFQGLPQYTLKRLSVAGNVAIGELRGEVVGKKDNEKFIGL